MSDKKIIGLRIGNRDEIYSPSIDARGYLNDKFGINYKGETPTKFVSGSFPLWWKKIHGAKSYAIVIETFDSAKDIGVPVILWIACNIKTNELSENQSLLDWIKWKSSKNPEFPNNVIWQGCNISCQYVVDENNKKIKLKNNLPNEYICEEIEDSCIYFGPSPRFKDSLYFARVYGLDVEANKLEYIVDFEKNKTKKLNTPYFVSDLFQAMIPHVVGMWTLAFKYRKQDDVKETKNFTKKMNSEWEEICEHVEKYYSEYNGINAKK